MKLNIFINDKLYKTVTVVGESYDPNFIWPQLQADRDAGLLTPYLNEDGKIALSFVKAK